MFKSLVGVVVLGMLLASVGCQNGKMDLGMKKEEPALEKAVVATGPKGSAVYLPSHGSVQILSTGGTAACDVCKTDAALYFSTGKMSEKCTVCGAMHYGVVRGK